MINSSPTLTARTTLALSEGRQVPLCPDGRAGGGPVGIIGAWRPRATGAARVTGIPTKEWRSSLAEGTISLARRSTLAPERRTPVDRYIGLDAHSSSCTVAVIGPSGKRLSSQVIETNAAASSRSCGDPQEPPSVSRGGSAGGWLYEMLAPHVQEIVVAGVPRVAGPRATSGTPSRWRRCCGSVRSRGASTRSAAGSRGSPTWPKPTGHWSATRSVSSTGSRA